MTCAYALGLHNLTFFAGLSPNPTVELLYDGKAELAEGPFFEPETNQLLWVDILAHTVNFLDLATTQNR